MTDSGTPRGVRDRAGAATERSLRERLFGSERRDEEESGPSATE